MSTLASLFFFLFLIPLFSARDAGLGARVGGVKGGDPLSSTPWGSSGSSLSLRSTCNSGALSDCAHTRAKNSKRTCKGGMWHTGTYSLIKRCGLNRLRKRSAALQDASSIPRVRSLNARPLHANAHSAGDRLVGPTLRPPLTDTLWPGDSLARSLDQLAVCN